MRRISRRSFLAVLFLAVLTAGISSSVITVRAEKTAEEFILVCMDPLSDKLACDCVQGYAQRNYGKLGEFLAGKLGRKVKVVYGESLTAAVKESAGRADLIIGKDSVVRHDAAKSKLNVAPVALLTGLDGKTTQTGLLVVRTKDAAQSVADLKGKGYRIYFGPEDSDEKHAAALALLKSVGVEVPAKLDIVATCTAAAGKVVEAPEGVKTVGVISSYAAPLLEGCGTVNKGDLRVLGETKPVPFITAFVTNKISDADRKAVLEALLATAKDADLLMAMESKHGFVQPGDEPRSAEQKKSR